MDISKYFWGLSKESLKETERILKDSSHSKFRQRFFTFLSRCDKPDELFSLVSKEKFIEIWPAMHSYWLRIKPREAVDFRLWWKTAYETLLKGHSRRQPLPKGQRGDLFIRVGKLIRKARLKKGFSQKELAVKIGMSQPDISKIEQGRINMTLETLDSLCKVLNVKKIDLD